MSQPANDMKHGGRYHLDDRGQRYCNIFPEIEKGDINVSVVEPGATALWHRHRKQADYQLVVKGSLKIGICNLPFLGYDASKYPDDEVKRIDKLHYEALEEWKDIREDNKLWSWSKDEPQIQWHYLSERNTCQGSLYIPTGLFHGCHNYTNEQAILIYHITEKYDGSDEERFDPNMMMWDWEREDK